MGALGSGVDFVSDMAVSAYSGGALMQTKFDQYGHGLNQDFTRDSELGVMTCDRCSWNKEEVCLHRKAKKGQPFPHCKGKLWQHALTDYTLLRGES